MNTTSKTKKSGFMKLDSSEVKKIRAMAQLGWDVPSIANAFDKSQSAIRRILKNETYYDETYHVVEHKPLDLDFCKMLRKKGMSYAEIARREGKHLNRARPYSPEYVRKNLRNNKVSSDWLV